MREMTLKEAAAMAAALRDGEEDDWTFEIIPGLNAYTVQAFDEEGYPCGTF